MAILGFADLRDALPPSLWDLGEMKRIQMADGATFDQVVQDIQAGLTSLNAEMLNMPHYGGMLAVQDNVEVEYAVDAGNGVQEATEYGIPDPKRGRTTGHSLPIKGYDRGLGWTQMFLRKARQSRLDADVRSAITDIRSHFQKKAFERFFKSTAETVGATSGASVPFADGGTADSNYVPLPNPEGKTFQNTHNHFLRYDTVANALAPAMLTLIEHGHNGPIDAIVPEADAATWKALTGWKAPEWQELAYMFSNTERASIPDITNYFGFVETQWGIVRVWLTPRLPTNYFGLYKTYGPLDQRNPLRMRIDPIVGFGWQLVPGNYVNAPTLMAVLYSEFGMGVGEDRTNGVAVYLNASGSYTDPTIS